MNDPDHSVHGLAGDTMAPDWPPLTLREVEQLLRGYPSLGMPNRIGWHSPRPLSAACLIDTDAGHSLFVKRHHRSVRSIATLGEEHRFMAWLRAAGIPLAEVLSDNHGQTAVQRGDWVYELHAQASGIDLYRETMSWVPPPERRHAYTAGQMLARLHDAAAGYEAAQRDTHILVARSELIVAADPVATLQAQLARRPGLADYLRQRDWPSDFARSLQPWHAIVQPRLIHQPRLWTHNDWHVSNLCWRDDSAEAPISAVLDFGLSAATFALFDLATAIERNAIAWLALDTGNQAVHTDIALALIDGYRQQRPLDHAAVHLLADLLPLVHMDFALSEVEYFYAITGSRANADIAYDTFLCGHADWFTGGSGQQLLQAIRGCA